MKIGICIGTSPGETKTRFALELAKACRAAQHEIDIFLFDDGIYNALPNSSIKCVTAELEAIAKDEGMVNVCVNMAKFRGVSETNKAEYVEISNLMAFSQLVNTSDRVISTK
jgi:sulfur relay (sulfurtransferase) complex TusBCD TusD component (DsrE family)